MFDLTSDDSFQACRNWLVTHRSYNEAISKLIEDLKHNVLMIQG